MLAPLIIYPVPEAFTLFLSANFYLILQKVMLGKHATLSFSKLLELVSLLDVLCLVFQRHHSMRSQNCLEVFLALIQNASVIIPGFFRPSAP
jgi:hypothetical protein